jgi:flagellin-specific chaperone FliS
MTAHVSFRDEPCRGGLLENHHLVERLYASFQRSCAAAQLACAQQEAVHFSSSIVRATQLTAILRECLDYARSPVLSAYLNSMFGYVLSQLAVSLGAQDQDALESAGLVMSELGKAFGVAHQGHR